MKTAFLMAGGGTGGHVIPGLAVARELQSRGHEVFFVGTRRGLEAKLVPARGFDIEWIEIGGLKRVGLIKTLRTLAQLPLSVLKVLGILRRRRPRAVFSMGGYVAGPVMLAARLRGLPVVLMEPNAMPGLTNRRMGQSAARALLSFEEAAQFFPSVRTEITGLPVRAEFFAIPPKPRTGELSIVVTGGSQGSRTLNQAAQESWPLFAKSGTAVWFLLQTGTEDHAQFQGAFEEAGIAGEVVPFIPDMPAAFAAADIVISRSGAGTVSELAAAGRPSILVPFPHAADQHQLRNAEAMVKAGASRLVLDSEMNGERLYREVMEMAQQPGLLETMSQAGRRFAKPDAARRAADVLEELAAR